MNAQNEYWKECISAALDEQGIVATTEQIAAIADSVAGAHECYGMAFYQAESPEPSRIKELEKSLKAEREMVGCTPCGGKGRIYSQGPYHGSDSQCWKCGGYGKHAP